MDNFSGMKDCNGKEVFVGDIVKYFVVGKIDKHGEKYAFSYGKGYKILFKDDESKIEVIGSIYSNPELLEDD